MKGAIIGDIIGSIYEYNNIKTKDFPLFQDKCFYTDDSIMTIAIAQGILYHRKTSTNLAKSLILALKSYGNKYPYADYGHNFNLWLKSKDEKPYGSYGNGALMRCSACGWLAENEEEAIYFGEINALVTHNHIEAIKACRLYSRLIYDAKKGMSKKTLYNIAKSEYELPKLDNVRENYEYDISCQGTLPIALSAFFESTSFEDAIRNAVSVGGDTDTICAITGALAEAYYGVPEDIENETLKFIPKDFYKIWNLN